MKLSLNEAYNTMLRRIAEQEGEVTASAVDKELQRRIKFTQGGFEDSFRCCWVGDPVGAKMFEEARSCCGEEEHQFVIDGKSYLVGFNYGH